MGMESYSGSPDGCIEYVTDYERRVGVAPQECLSFEGVAEELPLSPSSRSALDVVHEVCDAEPAIPLTVAGVEADAAAYAAEVELMREFGETAIKLRSLVTENGEVLRFWSSR